MDYIKPKCEMLIDQNHFIGNDPIGHCCYNDADYRVGEYHICKDCLELLKEGSLKITVPPFGTASVWEVNTKNLIQSLLKEKHDRVV